MRLKQLVNTERIGKTLTALEGKTACITGGSGGVGRALALALAHEGCDLILAARTRSELEKVAERIRKIENRRVLACEIDISDPSQTIALERAVQELGGLDILINAAASFCNESLAEIEVQNLINLIDTIARGSLLITKAMLPYLEKKHGNVLNFVTDWAVPGWAGPTPFSAAKWAVAGMGEALAREGIVNGVKVTNIFPGDIASKLDPDTPIKDILDELGESMIPLADIISTVLYVLNLQVSRVQSIVILPSDPAYLE